MKKKREVEIFVLQFDDEIDPMTNKDVLMLSVLRDKWKSSRTLLFQVEGVHAHNTM